MMERIVGRDRFEGKVCKNSYDLSITDLGNGHLEASVRPVVHYGDAGMLSDVALEDYRRECEGSKEDRAIANRTRAAARAKKKIRLICKLAGFDDLLTLTYRANMTNRVIVVAHLKEFHRRMKRLIPNWQYVCVLEKQVRGAFHAHLAVHKVPASLLARNGVKVKSFNVIRAVWRSVVGDDNGNIDIARGCRKARRSVAQLAGYISKYIMKAVGEDGQGDWKRSYFSSRDIAPPKPQRIRFNGYSLLECIQALWDYLDGQAKLWCNHNITKDGGYFLHFYGEARCP